MTRVRLWLVDEHYYIRSRDNSKVATEVCLVDVLTQSHVTTVMCDLCLVDVLYYIRSRDNSKVASEVCLVDVHYYIRSQ